MENLSEYLIEVTVKDKSLDNVLTSLKKIGLKLDKNFMPKKLRVKELDDNCNNFLVKGKINQEAVSTLNLSSNIANCWLNVGNIPF